MNTGRIRKTVYAEGGEVTDGGPTEGNRREEE